MIIVSGTKRSGTSMWMQILHAAGLPVVGEAFPERFGDRLSEANPRGFYESRLRRGVNFLTNPDPDTGVYLHPNLHQHHACKVFLGALPATEYAFLHRVLITVRPWRDYAASMARLSALETGTEPDEAARYEAAIEWWAELSAGLSDVLLRRYPAHVVSYDAVVLNPRAVVREVLEWVGAPTDWEAGAAAVDPALRRSGDAPTPKGLDSVTIEVFDELYDRVHRGRSLDGAFLQRLDNTRVRLAPVVDELLRRRDLAREQAAR